MMLNLPKSGLVRLAGPLAIFLLIVLLVSALGRVPYSWDGWRPATCMPAGAMDASRRPAGCFCEAVSSVLVRQPANTYSNLGYMLVGLLVLGGWRPGSFTDSGVPGRLLSRRIYLPIYGLAVFAIGAGSLFYHASLTF